MENEEDDSNKMVQNARKTSEQRPATKKPLRHRKTDHRGR